MKFTSKLLFALLSISAVANANAASVGVVGGYPSVSTLSGLSSLGHTITSVDSLNSSSLAGLDAVILGRNNTGNEALANFVYGGGTLITEWSAANYGMSLLGGSASDNYGNYYTNDPIVFTTAGLSAGLGVGLGASYSDTQATEFFQTITSVGSGIVYGNRTYNGGGAAIVGGAYGSGMVWVNGYDWGDSPTTATFTLLNNELNVAAVPEPETYAMLLVGLGLMGGIGRRKQK